MSTTIRDRRPDRSMTTATPRASGQISESDWDASLDEALAAELSRRATRRRAAFWLLAFVFAATMLGTTLPTPLYVIYQAQWHFPAAIITLIFAVYAAGVLAALLLAGRSSDQAGRKPVLAVALAASALSTVVFIFAPDVGVLLVGRIVSGLSAGLITGTATAALTELVPASAGRRASLVATAANMGGFRLGALVAALAEAGVALFLAGTVVAGIAVGAVFMGSLATANRLAPPGRRGQAVSAFFVACYCGLVIPVVGVGVASQFIGDFRSVLALSIVLAVLCVFALASIARARASDPEATR